MGGPFHFQLMNLFSIVLIVLLVVLGCISLITESTDGGDAYRFLSILLCFIGLTTAFVFCMVGAAEVRKEAVKMGVACYVVNSETGVSTFTWRSLDKRQ